jgi:hypothetical protein
VKVRDPHQCKKTVQELTFVSSLSADKANKSTAYQQFLLQGMQLVKGTIKTAANDGDTSSK